MIIDCPNCSTKYEVKAELLAEDGRSVRCSVCQHIWEQKPEEAAADADPVSDQGDEEVLEAEIVQEDDAGEAIDIELADAAGEDDVEPIPEGVRPVPTAEDFPPVSVGVIGTAEATKKAALIFLLLFFITFGAAVAARQAVVNIWEPSALLFSAIGLDVGVPGEGLRLSELVAEDQEKSGDRILYIESKVSNISEDTQALPPLDLLIMDDAGKTVKTVHVADWFKPLEKEEIGPGEDVRVKFGVRDFPDEAVRVKLIVANKKAVDEKPQEAKDDHG